MVKRFVFILYLLCRTGTISFCSDPEIFDLSFRRISPVGGFTYGSINSIGEDLNGFIWFGTTHGLYRYNTVDVQKFIHDPLDSTTIPNNSIRAIFCDKSGTLWIGTSRGLCIYDNRKDLFINKTFQDKSGEFLGTNVLDIFQGDGQNIYLLSTTMLGKYNTESKKFEKAFSDRSLKENFVCSVYDSKGRVWIGGVNGTVWLFEPSSQQIRKFCNLRSESISKIFPDDSGIWIGYNWAGLDYAGFDGNLIAHYGNKPENLNKINHNRVRDIYKDESDRIWISTYKGISIIDHGKTMSLLPQEISGLPYNSIYKIFRDSKKGIWIGTWSGGLAYRSDFDNRFIHSQKDQSGPERDDEFVSSFAEKNDGTILIGTEFGNLNKFDRSSNKMINIDLKTENGKKIENIKSLLYDKKTETLWVGTFIDGLWYQTKHETFLRPVTNFNNQRISVYALEKSDSGLWIGTFGTGLYHYNTGTGKMKQYISVPGERNSISNNFIRSVIYSKDSIIWVGTNNGLNRLNPKTRLFERFNYLPNGNNSISSDEIFTLQQDQQGLLWIGTSGGGINKYDPVTNTFTTIRMKDGLAGDDVYGIQEDKSGMLWVSTDNGITNIDPRQNTCRNFYRENELQGNQFNPGAAFQTSDGEILFGDTKGFTLFTPEQMKTNPVPPKVILTSLSVNNIPVTNHTEGTPLKGTLQTESVLKLSYHQNSLTFNFVANNFLLPDKNLFKYRLINYDNEWVEAGTQNYATYTKIPPGNYLFEVIACNNDNLWNNTPTQLKIIISSPFWFSIYAYLIYAVILILLSYLIRKWVLERQRFKKELLLERLINESETQIHEMKLQFFTNISHEFRTPLTLIASPVNLLVDKFSLDPMIREHLLTIQRNSNRLLQLIDQLNDVHKIELGKAVFQPEKTNIIELCRNVISCFNMEAMDKNINLSYSSEVEKLNVYIDPEKVDKIFFNILSNAMKFTGENGTIHITIDITHSDKFRAENIIVGDAIAGKILCVEFSDNGPGIAPEEIKIIFERFRQGKNHHSSGTGIGLHMAHEYIRMHKGNISVISEIGSGSTFTICFPLNDGIDEIKESTEIPDQALPFLQNKKIAEEDVVLTEKEKNITILIIEDNHELRNYLKNLLNNEYRIVTASNGKQGLETALTIIPDLIITDIMMPQMDGLEVCRQLKKDIETRHIPVILLTALNEPEKQIGGYKTGADAYITKPFDENILLAQIESLIRSRTTLREIFSDSDIEWANGMDPLFSDRMLIVKATSIVEQHLNDKTFVIDHLSDKLGISTSSLYRKLKVLTNQSPTEFVRYNRLKKAIRLMNNGNTNLDEIGFAVGFNSHSYFTSSFKKQYGKTPSDYLNDLKTKNNSSDKM
jgi:signal transduction histidine kinase/ligand-binding sensor domain-containing protein/DNA-binding response OmpR family regulator